MAGESHPRKEKHLLRLPSREAFLLTSFFSHYNSLGDPEEDEEKEEDIEVPKAMGDIF